MLDADWYGPEFSAESDPTTTREGVDIEECMAYAKEKGIGIILYLNDVGAKKFGLERAITIADQHYERAKKTVDFIRSRLWSRK